MEAQEKVIDANGEPVQGPQEKQGSDSVQAKLSWQHLGTERAREVVRVDERLAQGKNTVRQDLIEILKSPQDSWGSYTEGFKAVLDERKKAGEPTVALGVLRSQISRVLNAGKKHHSMVVGKLADTKIRWEVLLKSLPKTSTKGRPATAETTSTGDGINVDTETNVGTLVQVLHGACKRLITIGKEKDAMFAQYVGQNTLDMLETAQADYQAIFAKHNVGGIIKDKAAFLKELGFSTESVEVPAERTGTEG